MQKVYYGCVHSIVKLFVCKFGFNINFQVLKISLVTTYWLVVNYSFETSLTTPPFTPLVCIGYLIGYLLPCLDLTCVKDT
jgi:hypothetical protein